MSWVSERYKDARESVSSASDSIGNATGNLVGKIPGNENDWKRVAKVGVAATGVYFAAPYVASTLAAGATAAGTAGSYVNAAGQLVSSSVPSLGALGAGGVTGAGGMVGALGGWGNIAATGAMVGGGLLSANSAKDASKSLANSQIEAARIAADAAKFRPVGVTTRYGSSKFDMDQNGNIISAGYSPSQQTKSLQDRLTPMIDSGMAQFNRSPTDNIGLFNGGQRAMSLGNSYMSTSPQDQARKYMEDQMALINPSRERSLAELISTLQGQGRQGLAVGGTTDGGFRPSNPEMDAYYNAQRMQDLQLAADSTAGGMDYSKFGVDMTTAGGNMMSNYYNNQTNSFSPYNTALGGQVKLEGLAQNAMDMGIDIGAKGTAARDRSGQLLAAGTTDAANSMYQSNAYNPYAYGLGMLGSTLGKNYDMRTKADAEAQARAKWG